MTVLSAVPMTAMADNIWQRHLIAVRIAGWAGSLVLALGLFGRIMSFPFDHDEQIHVVAARMIFQAPLYSELGYNHLPGLPLLLGGFYISMGSDHLLQAGRVLIFLCWIVTTVLIALVAFRHTQDKRVSAVAILLLFAGMLLGAPGLLVTNNFPPVPFALLGVHLFLIALMSDGPVSWRMFASGASIGFAIALKISYVFLLPPIVASAMLVPGQIGLAQPWRRVLLPLLVGGLIGGLPVLVALLSGPSVLYEHTVRYFVDGHLGYWQHSTEPTASSLAEKMLVAEDVWLSRGGLLAGLLIGAEWILLVRHSPERLREWPVALVVGLIACAALGAFAPTPAYSQNFAPVVPFAVLLVVLLYARLSDKLRSRMWPLLATAAGLASIIVVPRLLAGLPVTVQPSQWTGNIIHGQGQRVRAAMNGAATTGRIATLSPVVALEGGLAVYREFSSGPFVYRVAESMPQSDRRWFRTTSPHELAAFLDRDPPAAIIIGREPLLDGTFAAYARLHGYLATGLGDAQTLVFLRPAAQRDKPRPIPIARRASPTKSAF